MSRQGRRFIRTILIGCFALAALVWMAVDQFGVPREEMLELLLATALVVGLVIAAAGGVVLLWVGLRKLRDRPGAD